MFTVISEWSFLLGLIWCFQAVLKNIIIIMVTLQYFRLKLFLEQFAIPACVLSSELPVNSRRVSSNEGRLQNGRRKFRLIACIVLLPQFLCVIRVNNVLNYWRCLWWHIANITCQINYVKLLDLYVDLSDHYVDLSESSQLVA